MTSFLGKAAFTPLFLVCAVVVAGCATDVTTSSGQRQSPSPKHYNLTGYSDVFKQGHGDACASPRRKSEQRYQSDTDYQMGWNDGSSVCRGR